MSAGDSFDRDGFRAERRMRVAIAAIGLGLAVFLYAVILPGVQGHG